MLALDPPAGGLGRVIDALSHRGHRVTRRERPACVLGLLQDPGQLPAPDLLLIRQHGGARGGLGTLAQVRSASRLPVVLFGGPLEGHGERVAALEMGADDYLAPNMPLAEIVARLGAVMRRAAWSATRTGAVATPVQPQLPSRPIEGGWRLSPNRRTVVAVEGGETVPLTGAEFELLRLLTSAHGEAVDREVISRGVFRRPWRVEDRAVDGLVKRVRRKLRADAIATVRGIGYALRFCDASDTGSIRNEVEICGPDTTEYAA